MLNPKQLNIFDEPETQAQDQKDRRKDNRLIHFAVIEPATEKFSAAVWGVGRKKETALKDALTHLVAFEDKTYKFSSVAPDIDDSEDLTIAIQDGKLIVLPCSKKFYKDICTYGGEIDFLQANNAAYLPEENIN